MKENVIDVLKYIFESYLQEDFDLDPSADIQSELSLIGFKKANINKAFSWMENLKLIELSQYKITSSYEMTNRVFTEDESERFSTEAKGFLCYLENKNFISLHLRESIIDQAMALEINDIDLEKIQWVTLIVLLNISDQQITYTDLEYILFEENPIIH